MPGARPVGPVKEGGLGGRPAEEDVREEQHERGEPRERDAREEADAADGGDGGERAAHALDEPLDAPHRVRLGDGRADTHDQVEREPDEADRRDAAERLRARGRGPARRGRGRAPHGAGASAGGPEPLGFVRVSCGPPCVHARRRAMKTMRHAYSVS